MCIDVERHGIVLALLNVKLFEAVFTKDIENHVTGELAGNFQNELLYHP